ncbi:lysophospholipid acyltransferase family protein [Crossiella sp. CA-258035]|uniref:lysophospholipid acyltransferase family protein n=1 Tax=Crossiella sp. CA-258035 TaxID=2981138 RepID=UPI0024BBF880|nr:lysophospholipid acyltransferase family protein [Crossiella sp. CA-258035]WHT17640.1 lysophospholipid acyltransferase family protein [Crossiella sp. CA-258035]
MKRRERGGFWVGLTATILYPVTWLLARRRTAGGTIPAEGPALLIMNHPSHLDPVLDAVFVHQQRRVPRFFAKHSLWRVLVVGSVFRATGQIPVYRGTSAAGDSLRAGDAALEEGKVVVIYPEGTLTHDEDGWPVLGRTGAARLALAHDVPIIPVVRWGTKAILDAPRKRFRPLPRKTVDFLIGEPLDLSAFRSRPVDRELLQEVTDLILLRLQELLGTLRGETPPGLPQSGQAA